MHKTLLGSGVVSLAVSALPAASTFAGALAILGVVLVGVGALAKDEEESK